jgi:hypothetical protein
MPETVSLLQGSIPQIPTKGILNYNPIQISEAGWNPPRAGADILTFVKEYNEKKSKAKEENNNGTEGAEDQDGGFKRFRIQLPYKDKDGNWKGFRIIDRQYSAELGGSKGSFTNGWKEGYAGPK